MVFQLFARKVEKPYNLDVLSSNVRMSWRGLIGLEPMSAMGVFTVTKNLEVYQIVVFEYFDDKRVYFSLTESIEDYEKELDRLADVMQKFLDEEEVVINDERVRPKVVGVDIGFKDMPEEPFITYFIFFRGKPRKGLNYYENIYEGELAEYPITAYWYFPPTSKVVNVVASGDVSVLGDNIVVMRLAEGDRISGYEKIVFKL